MSRNPDSRDELRRPDRRDDHKGWMPGVPPRRRTGPGSRGPAPNAQIEGLGLTGSIDKIVPEKGFGFLQGDNGIRYFFHFSVCLPSNRATFDNLYEGEKVRFDGVKDPKGPRASALSSLENVEGLAEGVGAPAAAGEASEEGQGNKA